MILLHMESRDEQSKPKRKTVSERSRREGPEGQLLIKSFSVTVAAQYRIQHPSI